MGRKRALGDDASSEDDFLPSDASASPPSSRLKRKRRASTRSRVSSRSNDQSDDARQQPQVICIPESPEEEDVVLTSVQELSPVVDGVKEVPNSEEQSQVENCGDKEGGEEGEGGEGEGRDGDSIEEMIGNDEDGDRMAGARDDASAENSVGGKLVWQTKSGFCGVAYAVVNKRMEPADKPDVFIVTLNSYEYILSA